METTISKLEDRELYIIASLFIQGHGDQATLHTFAAKALSATNLVRWQAAFSQAIVSPYVGSYAPPPVSTGYFAHPALRKSIKAGAAPPPPPVPPTAPADPFAVYSQSLETWYMEYRTAPFSNCGRICAFTKVMAAVGAKRLTSAWLVGTSIGTTFYRARGMEV